MPRTARAPVIAIVTLLLVGGVARAADPEAPPPVPEAAPPAPAEGTAAPGAVVPTGDVAAEAAKPARSWELGVRLVPIRWVSVPGWMLNLFTQNNVPLSSWGTGLGVFGRRGNFALMGSFNYMNMSPPDGNWLGKGNYQAASDTDFVQFKNLALWAVDVSVIWDAMFNSWFGMHWGAGLGVGIVSGRILRTSNGSGCTPENAGNVTQCHPIVCATGPCTEAQLASTEIPGNSTGSLDTAQTPHRFSEPSVPPALPIVNVLVGVDFRLPNTKGWEATIEGGFYDAFVLGFSIGYTF
jgi:opacity protein-like surface antigen